MTFTNPYGDARATSAAYVTALIGRLGDRDPFEVMATTPAALRSRLEGVSRERLIQPEAPGKWSALGVLVHLLDSEVVYGYRMRFIVAQPEQPIAGYDQDQWNRTLHGHQADVGLTLDAIDVLRRWTLQWIATLSDEERARWGDHSERGRESVDRIIRLLGAHDLVHLDQIDRILQAHA